MLSRLSKEKRKRAINAKLIRRGISQTEIAKRLKIDRSAVSNVIAGRRNTAYIRYAIADTLGLRYELVWPRENSGKKAA